MRPIGSGEELERRRVRALELLKSGLWPVEVARRVGVDRRSVRRWKAAVRAGGAPTGRGGGGGRAGKKTPPPAGAPWESPGRTGVAGRPRRRGARGRGAG